MRIELGSVKPDHFKTYWPGQYDMFSHFEYACSIPSVLHAVTTVKANGNANVNFNFSGCFTGDGEGYFAVIPIYKHTHTYQNIQRTAEFVVNFLGKAFFVPCYETITHNESDVDEFEVAGFHKEPAKTLSCPRIAQAFLSLECTFEKELDLSGSGKAALLIGRVNHIAVQEEYALGIDKKYEDGGFMHFIHAPKNLITGEGQPSAVAVNKIVRVNKGG